MAVCQDKNSSWKNDFADKKIKKNLMQINELNCYEYFLLQNVICAGRFSSVQGYKMM